MRQSKATGPARMALGRRPTRRRPPRYLARAIMAIAALLLLGSCTLGPSLRPPLATLGGNPSSADAAPTTAVSTMPIGPGGPGRTAPPIEWGACGADVATSAADGDEFTVHCATVTVPIIYAQPNRGHLTLRVAEAHNDQTQDDAQPLLVTLGDPGSRSYADIADIAAALPAAIRQRYVIVTLDARGTGQSTGINCVSQSTAAAIVGMSSDPSTEAGGSQLSAITRQLTFDCGDFVGPALTTINSTNAADDLDTIRAALGVPTLSMIATDGSATIGAVYADRYPGRVGAMVLGTPDDPLTTPQQHATASAAAAEKLFDDFAAACAGFDGGCPLGTAPRSRVQSVVDRLATSGTGTGDWVMTGGSILMALTELLPDQESWPTLASAIASIDTGDAAPLADLLTSERNGPSLTERLSGQILYSCNDNNFRWSETGISAAARGARGAAPLFGPFAVGAAALCASWPTPDVAPVRLSADGARPIIVIGAVRNPVQPYVEAQAVAGQLVSAVLLSWQSGSGNTYPGSACVNKIVNEYLMGDGVPDRGVLCPP